MHVPNFFQSLIASKVKEITSNIHHDKVHPKSKVAILIRTLDEEYLKSFHSILIQFFGPTILPCHLGIYIDGKVYHYYSETLHEGINIYDNFLETTLDDFFSPDIGLCPHPIDIIEIDDSYYDAIKTRFDDLQAARREREITKYNDAHQQQIMIPYNFFLSNCELLVMSLVMGKSVSYQEEFMRAELQDHISKNNISRIFYLFRDLVLLMYYESFCRNKNLVLIYNQFREWATLKLGVELNPITM